MLKGQEAFREELFSWLMVDMGHELRSGGIGVKTSKWRLTT
jgi:hypothetical protein